MKFDPNLMGYVPPDVTAAAELITRWARRENISTFEIAGIQNRVWATPLGVVAAPISPT